MRETNIRHKLAVLACLLLLLPASTHAERRTALVIGNAAYEIGLLRNSGHDASDMTTALRQLGFEVTLLRDAPRRSMVEAMDLFSRQLRHGGVGVFYFAGHGIQVGGENYLIPVDARIGREQDVPYEAVPVGRMLGGMEDADNQLNILILDACRDNPFARQWRASQRGLAVIQAARGSLIAYATAPGMVASDGDGRNGLYTSYLLQHLTTPGLSVEHLFKKVREGVVKATKGRQTPWESSSLIGDFAFAPQTVSNAEAVIWARVEQSSNLEDVTAFLQAYPNGQFAPAARLKLQQLQQLAAQQRLEEQNRLAEQARQQREREAAEARQREQERQREEEKQRLEAQQRLAAQQRLEEQNRLVEQERQREERASQTKQGPSASPPAQVARLEPESKLRERASVAVPGTVLRGRQGLSDEWTQQVRAFRMDAQAVSNREFLDFVKTYTQWKKSHLSKSFHDGDYLKHWQGDETVQPEDMDRPVHYISYFAAEAYCTARRKRIPSLNHYRAAATDTGIGDVRLSITYDAPYKAPQFNFPHVEWTNTWWDRGPDPGKRIRYQSGAIHNRKDTLEADKKYTGRSLGFRCVEY